MAYSKQTRAERGFHLLTRLGLLIALALAVLGRAAGQAEVRATSPSGGFSFSLLPKSLQRRPSVDFHVITELTNEGRKLALRSATEPVYYLAQAGGFTQLGENPPAGETPPNIERLTHAMEAALASSGYRPASPTTPLPALAVVFNFGSFPRFSMTFHDMEDEQLLKDARLTDAPWIRSEERDTESLVTVLLSNKRERDEVLQRASLIGGEKFSRGLSKALAEESVYRNGEESMGGPGVSLLKLTGPFERFRRANPNLTMLVEDSFNGCYFVIASAYDYRAMRTGRRVLLWRTKMTVNATGISMSESLPALVIAAGPFLGKEMPEAVTLSRTINRGGSVKLDELKVLETGVPTEKPKENAK